MTPKKKVGRPGQPVINGMKLCTKCKVLKPLDAFHKRSKREGHYCSACKACFADMLRDYRAKHPGKATAQVRAWQLKNPEKNRAHGHKRWLTHRDTMVAYHRQWQKKNRVKLAPIRREYAAKYRAKNLARVRETLSRWKRANKDKVNADTIRRRARLKGCEGKFTAAEWADVKAQQNYTCLGCGRREPEIRLTIDHIIPISRGGRNEKANIQGLCRPCNSAKNNRLPGEGRIKWDGSAPARKVIRE